MPRPKILGGVVDSFGLSTALVYEIKILRAGRDQEA